MGTASVTTELADQHWEKGCDLYREGDRAGAIDEWQESLRICPENAVVLYNLGCAFEDAGKHEQAMAEWQKAVEVDAQDWRSYLALAGAYWEQAKGRNSRTYWQKSCQAYREALTIKRRDRAYDSAALRAIGYMEWKIGNKRAAMEAIKAAIQNEPEETWGYDALGRMQARLGHWKGMVQTAKALGEVQSNETFDYRPCLRCLLSLAFLLIAVTTGAVALFRRH